MLTTGLLRVELAPEEYQLYSEGCGSRGQRINKETDQATDQSAQLPPSRQPFGNVF